MKIALKSSTFWTLSDQDQGQGQGAASKFFPFTTVQTVKFYISGLVQDSKL